MKNYKMIVLAVVLAVVSVNVFAQQPKPGCVITIEGGELCDLPTAAYSTSVQAAQEPFDKEAKRVVETFINADRAFQPIRDGKSSIPVSTETSSVWIAPIAIIAILAICLLAFLAGLFYRRRRNNQAQQNPGQAPVAAQPPVVRNGQPVLFETTVNVPQFNLSTPFVHPPIPTRYHENNSGCHQQYQQRQAGPSEHRVVIEVEHRNQPRQDHDKDRHQDHTRRDDRRQPRPRTSRPHTPPPPAPEPHHDEPAREHNGSGNGTATAIAIGLLLLVGLGRTANAQTSELHNDIWYHVVVGGVEKLYRPPAVNAIPAKPANPASKPAPQVAAPRHHATPSAPARRVLSPEERELVQSVNRLEHKVDAMESRTTNTGNPSTGAIKSLADKVDAIEADQRKLADNHNKLVARVQTIEAVSDKTGNAIATVQQRLGNDEDRLSKDEHLLNLTAAATLTRSKENLCELYKAQVPAGSPASKHLKGCKL